MTPFLPSSLAPSTDAPPTGPATTSDRSIADWTRQLGAPSPETRRSKLLARTGGLVAIVGLLMYLTWRAAYTIPDGPGVWFAWTLLGFEALPLFALTMRTITLWSIDAPAPPPVPADESRWSVAVLIPTYNEPVEVIAPTIAAAVALEPVHQTWVLDDGDRPWVEELCIAYGARYVRREHHEHAKAGNINHALDLMRFEATVSGSEPVDIIAVLDCDHVPLPHFLTSTLGWFEDDDIALVQGPQAYYNGGAFDDDGFSGEQGMFFNVLMPARQQAGVGPFWCGSTSLLRLSALVNVGGVATQTVTEDMHTTLLLIRDGWRTVYHHQTLAVGLAPATAEQYLMQRRRWGMGSMQILAHERLWKAKSWLSWRNFYEYLVGTVWWLEGIATLVAFAIPLGIMVSGATTSTADPLIFTAAFVTMFATRVWGMRRLMRKELQIRTAFALRVLRIPVGIACLWWLATRRTLEFEVTEKGGSRRRVRGRIPRVVWGVASIVALTAAYAACGIAGLVPWRTDEASTAAAGIWLLVAAWVLATGIARIRAGEFATSRRDAYRAPVDAPVRLNGLAGELVDISAGGAAVAVPAGTAPGLGIVELELPGAQPVKALVASASRRRPGSDREIVSLQVLSTDWAARRELSMWMFHTPADAVPGLPEGVPAIAVRR